MEYLPDWLSMQDLPAYLVLVAVAGLAAGLLGVGGGLIIVPTLIWIYSAKGFDGTIVAHLAVGTSLASIVATSISSVYAHQGSLVFVVDIDRITQIADEIDVGVAERLLEEQEEP